MVGFCFLGDTSFSDNHFKSLRTTKSFFSCCFPSNPGCVVFHVNVDYFSFVWPLFTMIFNNNMIANLQTFIR
jgi:hypothetical protein